MSVIEITARSGFPELSSMFTVHRTFVSGAKCFYTWTHFEAKHRRVNVYDIMTHVVTTEDG